MSILEQRYASPEMVEIFSDTKKAQTWRKLWLSLATNQKDLGLKISEEQIAELKNAIDTCDFEVVQRYEQQSHHDVMAHLKAYADDCPKAAPILHLGATSQYIVDNTNIIQMQNGLNLIKDKAIKIAIELSKFAEKWRDQPTLGFTHFQPAQPTTVGKRACLWLNDIMLDLEIIHNIKLPFRSIAGATGTQASYMRLFNNDYGKVCDLSDKIAHDFGFSGLVIDVCGQTYTRKIDSFVLNALSGLAQSASKFAHDIRLLSGLGEVSEPFGDNQVGSSAMPYKRNPIRSEKICGLARHVIINALNPAITSSTQWLERTLDDSSNSRLSISQAFLGVDSILDTYLSIIKNLTVWPEIIDKNLLDGIEKLATENIMMDLVNLGYSRQEVHETIRKYSAGSTDGRGLFEKMREDPMFTSIDFQDMLDPATHTGAANTQTKIFLLTTKERLEKWAKQK